ncbi:MAG: hypothetical protein WBF99_14490 [Xanthobacteraceae bacterium]
MNAETIESELHAAEERGFHQSSSEYIPDLAGVSLSLPIGPRQLSIVVAGPTSRCIERRPITAAIMREVILHYQPSRKINL